MPKTIEVPAFDAPWWVDYRYLWNAEGWRGVLHALKMDIEWGLYRLIRRSPPLTEAERLSIIEAFDMPAGKAEREAAWRQFLLEEGPYGPEDPARD